MYIFCIVKLFHPIYELERQIVPKHTFLLRKTSTIFEFEYIRRMANSVFNQNRIFIIYT